MSFTAQNIHDNRPAPQVVITPYLFIAVLCKPYGETWIPRKNVLVQPHWLAT